MSDMGDDFAARAKASQEKRAKNRDNSAARLMSAGIAFESKNIGAHLIVSHAGVVIDFWPGTGLWIERGKTSRNRGVASLVTYLKDKQND